MKNKKTFAAFIFTFSLFFTSCSLSVDSESSCKSTLCNGFWSYEYDSEPLITRNGNFSFNDDGTCQYYTPGHQWNGNWSLGEVVDLTSKMSYRWINVNMESDIGMGVGSEFEIKLYPGDPKNSLDLSGASYYHFNDDSKPIN